MPDKIHKLKKRKIFTYIISIIIFIVVVIIGANYYLQQKDAIHIAFVGPLSGPNKTQGISLLRGIQLYIDTINRKEGIEGKKIVLETYDDQNEAQLAENKALEIAQHSQAVAVIGHFYSDASISGSKVYKQYGIPAVTPTSTNIRVNSDNDWYFRIIFNDDLQGKFLVNYLQKVLGENVLTIIHEDLSYGDYLAQVAERTAREIGITVNYKERFETLETSGDEKKLDESLMQIVESLKNKRDVGAIFLAAHASEGVKLVKLIRDAGIRNPIIVPDAFNNMTFINGFDHYPEERKSPGYYTNGIYVTTPLIFDTANERAQRFKELYKTVYSEEPDIRSAFSYDATMVIGEALKHIDLQANLSEKRLAIKNYLTGINTSNDAIVGTTGLNYFKNGNAQKPISVGILKNKTIISAPIQLQETLEDSKDTVYVDGKVMRKVNIVYTGILPKEIYDVNMDELTYSFNFYLWFRYGDKVINPSEIIFTNAVKPVTIGNATVIKESEQAIYQVFEVSGSFKADFDPYEHTYKQHTFGVSFRHQNLMRNSIIYATDVLGMELNRDRDWLAVVRGARVFQPSFLKKWAISQGRVSQNIVKLNTLGDPDYLTGDNVPEYSLFSAVILVKEASFRVANLIPHKISNIILLMTVIAFIMILIAEKTYFNSHKRFFLIVKALLFLPFLSATEVALTDWLLAKHVHTYQLEPILLGVHVLWWIVPAFFINSAIKLFLWIPLEESTEQKIPNLVRAFFSFIIYLMAFFGIVAFVLNQTLTSLLATSGMFVMVIGLAIQVNISNVFSGIALNIERSFRVGHWVKIGNFDEGKVVDINWRSTKIMMRNYSILSIPNSVTAESCIYNYSSPNKEIEFWIFIHVDLMHPPEKVEKILLDAVASVPEVLKSPAPFTRIREVDDWAAKYTVGYCSTDYGKRFTIQKLVWHKVLQNLKRNGITPMIQQQKVHVLQSAPEEEITLKSPRALLQEIDLFQSLPEKICQELSEIASIMLFKEGETIIQQGCKHDALYLIVEGVVSMQTQLGQTGGLKMKEPIEISRMGPGELFGEFECFTGAEATFTIAALTNTHLLTLTRAELHSLLVHSPEAISSISKKLAQRLAQGNKTPLATCQVTHENETNFYDGVWTKMQKLFT